MIEILSLSLISPAEITSKVSQRISTVLGELRISCLSLKLDRINTIGDCSRFQTCETRTDSNLYVLSYHTCFFFFRLIRIQ